MLFKKIVFFKQIVELLMPTNPSRVLCGSWQHPACCTGGQRLDGKGEVVLVFGSLVFMRSGEDRGYEWGGGGTHLHH